MLKKREDSIKESYCQPNSLLFGKELFGVFKGSENIL
jgi:hypothetical protein